MSEPRQVVLIMTDTQPTSLVGCYPDAPSFIKTPNLDRLAEQGIRFDKAYCCQPVCGPARSALFTGVYPHTNGSWSNTQPLGDSIYTIGQRLEDAGVQTGYVGKWHLDAGDYFGEGDCPDGWDDTYWYDMRNYLDQLSPEDRLKSRQATNAGKVPASFTFGHRVSNRAMEFLQHHYNDDFLLVVSYDEPHGPYLCPEEYMEMYEDVTWPQKENCFDDLSDKPEHIRAWAGPDYLARAAEKRVQPKHPQAYLACNSFIDSEIGRVIETIDRLAPGALVIYTSDHGASLGAHGLNDKGAAMYEEITRIPMIARWPNQAPEETTHTHPVSHIDLAPTILQALGQEDVPFLEGHSLLPALTDPAQAVNDAIYIEFGRYEIDHDTFGGFQPIRCIRDDRYKLAVNLLSSDELYDLDEDPQELNNLIESPAHSGIRDRLHDQLIDWMDRTRDPFRGYYWHRRPWRADAPEPSWQYGGYTRQRPPDGYHPKQLDYDTGLPINELTRRK